MMEMNIFYHLILQMYVKVEYWPIHSTGNIFNPCSVNDLIYRITGSYVKEEDVDI